MGPFFHKKPIVDLPLDGGKIPYAKHLIECPSDGQKGLSPLDHGPA